VFAPKTHVFIPDTKIAASEVLVFTSKTLVFALDSLVFKPASFGRQKRPHGKIKDLIEFEVEDSGKTVYFAVQAENDGKKGGWGPMVSALIP
jgi:hypothetical protein